jgi:hypothetical protein
MIKLIRTKTALLAVLVLVGSSSEALAFQPRPDEPSIDVQFCIEFCGTLRLKTSAATASVGPIANTPSGSRHWSKRTRRDGRRRVASSALGTLLRRQGHRVAA